MTAESIPGEPRSTTEAGLCAASACSTATMIVVGSMIGSGIFIVSADIARQTGSAGGLLFAWIITGLLTISAALSYGELAALLPHAGGQYVYLRESYSPLWGFLYGWTLFLVIQTGTIAAVADWICAISRRAWRRRFRRNAGLSIRLRFLRNTPSVCRCSSWWPYS